MIASFSMTISFNRRTSFGLRFRSYLKMVLQASNKYVRYKKVMQSLSQSEKEMFRDAYNFFDKSRKGYIVVEDFRRALKRICQNPREDEAEDLLKENDINGDGKVTFEELVVTTVKRLQHADSDEKKRKFDNDKDKTNEEGRVIADDEEDAYVNGEQNMESEEELKVLFQKFDLDNDGVISREEFVKLLTQFGNRYSASDIEEIMGDVDENHDGLLQYEEFVKIMSLQ